jgi:proteasome lid subunit RPN8/RPN11
MKNQKKQKIKASQNQLTQKLNLLAEDEQVAQSDHPVLRFSPTAWAKLLYFRDKSASEVGGFGITEPDDLLYITEFITVKQQVTSVSVKFDDEAVANYFDQQVDLGRKPEQFARHWLHTHPGNSPEPSGVDEDTFNRVFGGCQWAVMFILAQENQVHAELTFNVGPGGRILIPVEIDYRQDFGPSNHELWDTEFKTNVERVKEFTEFGSEQSVLQAASYGGCALPYDFVDEFEKMDAVGRQLILDELAEMPELWDEEEVMYL